MAARAFGLMETDNINSDQLSNTKVGNGELAISVVQRERTAMEPRRMAASATKAKHRLAANEPILLDLFLQGLRPRGSN